MHLLRRRPARDDVLIAAAGLAFGLALWGLGALGDAQERHGALVLLPLAAMCLATLGRRTAQPWVLLLAVLAQIADATMGTFLPTVILFTDVVYASVLYGSPRSGRVVTRASVAFSVAAVLVLLALVPPGEVLLFGALCAGLTVAPAWTGLLLRDHREAAAAERLRAEQTALLAEFDRNQAVQEERARMARELHDVVANHLSAIAIHATAAQAAADGREDAEGDGRRAAEAAQQALGVIRENSVRGLTEMRRLIGLLRDAEGTDESPTASPSLDALDALLARCRASAAPETAESFTFVLKDERTSAAPLPAPVELAAYRIVQEAATNALKHAAPGEVTVRLVRPRPESALTVHVTSAIQRDDAHATGPRAPGAGAGLVGMRERAALLGGELEVGPDAGGTRWEVWARLPVAGEERR
ncbi:sensor histidine kinase [Streptomyces sulphureus]|uniref:sensor histidine kinase n=1 Tax=Streptomyces sulphureus TaxID=47758 RepID=UPI0003750960|nr:histidine kinase [Streptomyces sulphureus]